jgi:tetratricopeptide (TPR) repeat protein
MNSPTSFRFSSTKSFQLFAQGLQSLQSYERSPSAGNLSDAEGNFGECVRRFPKDVLPRFYYGVVKTLRGYDGLDEAIEQFNLVLKSEADDLVPDAKYNLAIAHLEKYSPHDSEVALDLLRQTRAEVAKRQENKKQKEPRLETVRLQALILETYLYVEEAVRFSPSDAVFKEAEGRLDSFWKDYNESPVLEGVRPDLLADFYNTSGYYWNARAKHAKGDEQTGFAEKARTNYGQALEQKKDWIPAKSNLARLYVELLNEPSIAKRLCEEILGSRPSDYYTRYLLGKIYEAEGATAQAIGSYKKAGTKIPEANLNLGLLYEKMGALEYASNALGRVVAAEDVRESTRKKAQEALRRVSDRRKLDPNDPATRA